MKKSIKEKLGLIAIILSIIISLMKILPPIIEYIITKSTPFKEINNRVECLEYQNRINEKQKGLLR